MSTVELGAFRTAAGLAFVGVLTAHFYHLFVGGGPELLFACNVLVLLALAVVAVREQRRWAGAFSSAVAAETIVAFGVLALILGLVTAVVPLMLGGAETLTFDAASVRRLGLPFAQGLASAGLAPVIAVLVRINGAATDGGGEDERLVAAEALGAAMAQLTAELGMACAAAAKLNVALTDAAVHTARIAPDLAQHVDAVVQATGKIGPAVAASVATATAAVGAAATGLADELDGAAKRVAGGSGDVEIRLASLGTAARTGKAELTRLSGALGKVSTNAEETAELLDALNTLTASVESFMVRRSSP